MVWLFVVIFGLPCLLIRYAISLGQEDAYAHIQKENRDIDRSERSRWLGLVVDKDLESMIKNSLGKKSSAELYNNEICNAVDEIGLGYCIGCKHIMSVGEEVIRACYEGFEESDAKTLAARIIMANRGKLLEEDAVFGISVNEKKYRNEQIVESNEKARLVAWINNRLNEHGIYEQLVADAGINIYIVNNNYTSYGNFGGSYKWLPMIGVVRRRDIKEY